MSTRRATRRAARRQEILDAAMELVVEDGLDALTIARLAKEVDAAVGAIYRYFTGKDAVIVQLQLAAVDAMAEQLGEALEAADAAVVDLSPQAAALTRVLVAFCSWPVFATRHPALYRLVDRSISDPRRILDDEHVATMDQAILPIIARCATLLQEGVDCGALEPGDAALRAYSLWAALHGAGHLTKRDARVPASLQSSRVRVELLRVLLRGWGASDDALERAWATTETLSGGRA